MSEPTYGSALRTSWKLAWHHKNLWPFGLFALMLGQFGFLEILTKIWAVRSNTTSDVVRASQGVFSSNTWFQLQQLFADSSARWVWAVWLLIILLGLGIALLVVATVSQGALVYVGAKYAKHTVRFPSESAAWHAGVRHFWRVLGLNALRKLFVWVSAFALAELALFLAAGQSVWLWLSFAGALILGIIFSIITMYAIGYVVVEEYSFAMSFNQGLRLFLRHPLVSLETGVITLLINIVLMFFGLFALLYVFFLPNIIIKYLAMWLPVSQLGQAVGALSYALFLAVSLAAGAIFAVFSTSVWAYLFSKMHHGRMTSSILRMFGRD